MVWCDGVNRKWFGAVILLALIVFVIGYQGRLNAKEQKAAKEICITFDELPAAESFDTIDRSAVISRILEALKKHEAKAAGFVVGKNIGSSFDLLGQWLNGGHLLGNLTYSHQDLNEMGVEQFIKDIAAGWEALEAMLSGFGQGNRYFRYPYLHYGSTVETKRQVRLYLDEHDIVVAHATVVVEDYLYDLSLQNIGARGDSAEYRALRYEYVTHVIEEIERCEQLAREVLKRPARHILQLRANRLNALFLDGLLTAIEDMGYKFVSLDHALEDNLYSAPEAYFDLRGVGYLDMLKQSDPDLLPAE